MSQLAIFHGIVVREIDGFLTCLCTVLQLFHNFGVIIHLSLYKGSETFITVWFCVFRVIPMSVLLA